MPSESEAAELAAAAEAEAADAARAAGTAGSGTPGGSGEQPPPAASAPQTVPLERFRAVIGQRAEREAQLLEARRQLELANATIEEFKKLSEGAAQAAAQGAASVGGAAAPARAPAAGAGQKVPSAAEIEQLVAAEAARRDFTRQCNDAFAEGKKAHSDFEKVIADLNALSPVFDPRLQRTVMPQSLIEAALATGNAPEVLYALGKDNSLADRVLTMTPLQQAAELTKLSIKLEGSGEAGQAELPAVSRAPAPVRPKVTGTGGTPAQWDPADTEHFSTAEWIAKREADLKRKETRH
jgi:hypothetical protein